MSSDYERIRQAITFINAEKQNQPSLEAVAHEAGISPAYLQRLFRRFVGVSPKRFLQFLTAAEAKRLLRESVPVLDTAFQVGCSGPGRLHDLILNTEAMTPGEYAKGGTGLSIRYGFCDSPFGQAVLAMTERGICNLRFVDNQAREKELTELRNAWFNADLTRDDRAVAKIGKLIFGKKRREFLLQLKGTNFQLKVWEGLLRLPEQSLVSYQDLARRIGNPGASRAVANAVGANPIAYLIPCHRVIRSSGALGGYRWGLDRKAMILAHESASLADQKSPPRKN